MVFYFSREAYQEMPTAMSLFSVTKELKFMDDTTNRQLCSISQANSQLDLIDSFSIKQITKLKTLLNQNKSKFSHFETLVKTS